ALGEHRLGGLVLRAAAAGWPERVRQGGGAGDEPARHARGPLARRAGDDARRAGRDGGAGDLLALVGARGDGSSAQRAGRRAATAAGERRGGDGDVRAFVRERGGDALGEPAGGGAEGIGAARDDGGRDPAHRAHPAGRGCGPRGDRRRLRRDLDGRAGAGGCLDVSGAVCGAGAAGVERGGPGEAGGWQRDAGVAGGGAGGGAAQARAAALDEDDRGAGREEGRRAAAVSRGSPGTGGAKRRLGSGPSGLGSGPSGLGSVPSGLGSGPSGLGSAAPSAPLGSGATRLDSNPDGSSPTSSAGAAGAEPSGRGAPAGPRGEAPESRRAAGPLAASGAVPYCAVPVMRWSWSVWGERLSAASSRRIS